MRSSNCKIVVSIFFLSTGSVNVVRAMICVSLALAKKRFVLLCADERCGGVLVIHEACF